MADKKREKSSADLIKEARDSVGATTPPKAKTSKVPQIVRPSDRIAPTYTPAPAPPVKPPTAPPMRRASEQAPSTSQSTRLPSQPPSTRTATPTAPHGPVKDTTATILNGLGWLFIVLALGLAVFLVVGAFAEPDRTTDLVIGGAIIVLFPLALGIALVAVARRRKGMVAAKAGSTQALGSVPLTGTSRGRRSSGVPAREGETVLASVTGVPAGSTGGANVGKIIAAVVALIIFTSATGFGALFLIGGIMFLIARAIKNASSAQDALGKVFPASARLTITDQRVVMTTRSWAPNNPETTTERPISAIEDFKAATGNKPSVRITFTDGEKLEMSTSVASAEAVKHALQGLTA